MTFLGITKRRPVRSQRDRTLTKKTTMMKCNTTHYGSLTRISDLEARPYDVEKVPYSSWATGDYVIGRYVGPQEGLYNLELSDGSLQPLKMNDMVVGALGDRQATKEIVGTWELIDGACNPISMQMICGSGIYGIETSRCIKYAPSPNFIYEGHCLRFGTKLSMKDFGPEVNDESHCKMILIVGSSMSCGKTFTGQALIDIIKHDLGLTKVAAAKFTGVGYNNDIQQFSEAGADFVCDFVDAGYPSTVMPPEEYRQHALPAILSLLAEQNPDCIVAEVGASPFEQYNGVEVLKHMLSNAYSSQVYLVICASDAYGVLGLREALVKEGLAKGILGVSGMAACNSAGAALVNRISGLQAFNMNDPASVADIRMILEKCLLED